MCSDASARRTIDIRVTRDGLEESSGASLDSGDCMLLLFNTLSDARLPKENAAITEVAVARSDGDDDVVSDGDDDVVGNVAELNSPETFVFTS